MPPTARILRALAEELDPTMCERTRREERQFQRIMKVAPTLLTFWSASRFSFSLLAVAMKMSTSTLRRHFVDMPALLGFLIRQHLQTIEAALTEIPAGAPCHLRRAAYLTATRDEHGALTGRHTLLLNNLPHLPDDVRLPLIELQERIAVRLAPPEDAAFAISVLDDPVIPPSRIETILATPASAWYETPAPPAALPATDDAPAQAARNSGSGALASLLSEAALRAAPQAHTTRSQARAFAPAMALGP